ncbi:MAG: lysine 2,3-aminomutase [Bacteroidia bacterium]|nr:lysine 2,3-aminomutase [Bacteroidia bacterium]MCZ2278311.1 lysine 2,3-aminomutase [Bacteroidia bacterium]
MDKTKLKSFSLSNYLKIPQVQDYLTKEQKWNIRVVGSVLPFKVNEYVVNELINWEQVPDDPIFTLTFPQKGMLKPDDFKRISNALYKGIQKEELNLLVHNIRMELNPHPAGQVAHNVPEIDGLAVSGLQHKYRETLLFFPSHGQTCHAYCTFCFRWPQFVGDHNLKFALSETNTLHRYIRHHKEITDILITGGDPMIMATQRLKSYIEPLLSVQFSHLQTIRIGTKALGYWPYRFTTDPDANELLKLFDKVVAAGKHLSIMAHFSHYRELQTPAVKEAIQRIRNTGAEIRTQSPVMRHINDDAKIWLKMWKTQVKLGCIPYYMFIARDTGAQHFFSIPLVQAQEIFKKAYQSVSGIARTVRGPSMSTDPGKIQILGTTKIRDDKVFVLRFLQGRNPEWVQQPFFARFDPAAIWFDDLKPAFGKSKFFFEEDETDLLSNFMAS